MGFHRETEGPKKRSHIPSQSPTRIVSGFTLHKWRSLTYFLSFFALSPSLSHTHALTHSLTFAGPSPSPLLSLSLSLSQQLQPQKNGSVAQNRDKPQMKSLRKEKYNNSGADLFVFCRDLSAERDWAMAKVHFGRRKGGSPTERQEKDKEKEKKKTGRTKWDVLPDPFAWYVRAN